MNDNSAIGAIVQARMGSKRLPGKVMMEICGRPMLWHVVNRLRFARLINATIVATTTNKEDDVIEEFCRSASIPIYRGSQDDVLDRYYQAAEMNDIEIIVRITADCPLIDPVIVDRVVAAYLKNRDIFCGSSNVIKRTYPRGLDVEVFTISALETARRKTLNDCQREHVTLYFYERPESFKLINIENGQDLSDLRWTVDEEKDLIFVKEVYKRLYKDNSIFSMSDILALLKKLSNLGQINKDVKQKVI